MTLEEIPPAEWIYHRLIDTDGNIWEITDTSIRENKIVAHIRSGDKKKAVFATEAYNFEVIE